MIVTLDFNNINTKEEFHNYIQKKFSFKNYHNNLDSLYDEMTSFTTNVIIEIYNLNYIIDSLGNYASIFIGLLEDIKEERKNIVISFKS